MLVRDGAVGMGVDQKAARAMTRNTSVQRWRATGYLGVSRNRQSDEQRRPLRNVGPSASTAGGVGR